MNLFGRRKSKDSVGSSEQTKKTGEIRLYVSRESLRSIPLWKKGIKTLFLYFLFVWLRRRVILTTYALYYYGGSWFGKDDQPFPIDTITVELDQSRLESIGRMGDVRIHRAGGGDMVVKFDNLSLPSVLQKKHIQARHDSNIRPLWKFHQVHEAFTVALMLVLSLSVPLAVLAIRLFGAAGFIAALIEVVLLCIIGYLFGR